MKTLRRYIEEGSIYFTTSLTKGKRKVFSDPEAALEVISQIYRLRENGNMNLLAFVVMPEHFHLLCQPLDKNISLIMRHIKRNSSYNLCRAMDLQPPLWVKRFHDEILDTREGVLETIEYIHYNPVKRGLVDKPENFPFSSANPEFDLDWEDVL